MRGCIAIKERRTLCSRWKQLSQMSSSNKYTVQRSRKERGGVKECGGGTTKSEESGDEKGRRGETHQYEAHNFKPVSATVSGR